MKLLRTAALLSVVIGSPVHLVASEVRIVSPDADTAVFDEVDVIVSISSDQAAESVELSVDDKVVGVSSTPPFRFLIDVGGENREHEFSVVAMFEDGSQARHQLVTPAVAIDLEVDLALDQVYVTVSRSGSPVLDLSADDFLVLDDGEPQDLVTFERGDVPMTIAFLVDASESMMGGYLQSAVEAAKGFLSRLTPLDEATLMVFSDRLHQIAEPSVELAGAGEALDDLDPGGGTALSDFLYSALRILDSRHGRPVVILLSDGVDTLSFLRMEEVLWKVRRTDAVIYRVQVQESFSRGLGYATVWRTMRQQKAEVDGLDQAVTESGGRVEILRQIDDLPAALDEILQELRQQYVLGYYPPLADGSATYRPLEVRVLRPGADVRTRAGVVR